MAAPHPVSPAAAAGELAGFLRSAAWPRRPRWTAQWAGRLSDQWARPTTTSGPWLVARPARRGFPLKANALLSNCQVGPHPTVSHLAVFPFSRLPSPASNRSKIATSARGARVSAAILAIDDQRQGRNRPLPLPRQLGFRPRFSPSTTKARS